MNIMGCCIRLQLYLVDVVRRRDVNCTETCMDGLILSLGYFWRVQNPPWGCKPGTVPSLKGTTTVMWCGQYHSKSQQHDKKCTAKHHDWIIPTKYICVPHWYHHTVHFTLSSCTSSARLYQVPRSVSMIAAHSCVVWTTTSLVCMHVGWVATTDVSKKPSQSGTHPCAGEEPIVFCQLSPKCRAHVPNSIAECH